METKKTTNKTKNKTQNKQNSSTKMCGSCKTKACK